MKLQYSEPAIYTSINNGTHSYFMIVFLQIFYEFEENSKFSNYKSTLIKENNRKDKEFLMCENALQHLRPSYF